MIRYPHNQQYNMSTTRAIVKNTSVQIIGKITSTALGLLGLGLMTRYLGPEKFGWYITTMSFLQFIGILIDFGLIPVTAQMLSEPEHDKNKLFRNLIGFRLTSAIIFLGLAPLLALFFPYPPQVKIAIVISTLTFLSVAMNQVFIGLYQNKLQMHLSAIGENIGRIIFTIGLWLCIKNQASFLTVMWVVVLNSLIYTICMWFSARKFTAISPAFDWNIWKSIIKKMWPVAISIIFNVVYLRGDTVLLSLFKSQQEVGIYGAAYRVIDILAQTAMMLMGVMLPLLSYYWSRSLKTEFRKFYQQAFDGMMLFAVPLTIGTIILADKIMNLVAPEYNAGAPLKILALAVFGVFLGSIFGHTAVAINKQKQTIWIYVSDAVLTLAGYLYFIPKFGMYGAAWMTVFSEFYAGILLLIVIKHYTKEKIQTLTFGKILLAGVLMGFALNYLIKLNVILLVIIGVLVYGLVLLVTKAISQETLKEILAIKQK
ncbi:MAG: Polysaccharide biosynthesis protein [Candidatus Magasanikbacteria bacterium GW2011_GWC2_37_14]|uniref:Polysaccharide biosynthesis protein n=1 Tax=Candidatus Magasanikbacteria bacterium GW2011_GWC2_37_14 TaxID=1619046 RepID=A0A0G0GNS6_9BACT|nr:MAG: Polysaccharide biosynthesis protein [Candidatus Magasanikbacteria bacterium GW2011_GWC2_37_14]